MTNYNRDELISWLRNGVCSVTFTKVDGTVREMQCTLNNDYLPKQTDLEEQIQKVTTKSDSVISVWDTVKQGWRSFRLDSITNVNRGTHQ